MLGKKINKLTKKEIIKLVSKEIRENKIYKLKLKEKETLSENFINATKKVVALKRNLRNSESNLENAYKLISNLRNQIVESTSKNDEKIGWLNDSITFLNMEIMKLNKNISDLESELNDEVQISISSNKKYYDKKIELEEFKSSNKQLLKQVLNNLIRG